jgi:type IV pilus assembly protein PilM
MQLKLPEQFTRGKAAVAPDTDKKKESLVGLDVSGTGIAAARVVDGRVRTASLTGVLPDFMADGEVSDPAGLGDVLAEFFAANGMPKKVRMGVASPRVVIRTIELPLIGDRKQLDAAVRFQAQDHIPMPLSEAVLDYQVLRQFQSGDAQKLEVMLVAASQGLVHGVTEAAKRAGIKLQGIDLSAFALMRVLYPGQASSNETIAYVHFGDMVGVTLGQGDVCRFTRATANGYEAMVGRLSERAKLTREHARMWIDYVGVEAPTASIEGDADVIRLARDEIEAAVDSLGNDVSAAIDFHTAQESTAHVTRVMLAGPGATIPGVAAQLQQRLAMQVDVPAPLGALDASAIQGSGLDERRLTLAAGLALEEVVAL